MLKNLDFSYTSTHLDYLLYWPFLWVILVVQHPVFFILSIFSASTFYSRNHCMRKRHLYWRVLCSMSLPTYLDPIRTRLYIPCKRRFYSLIISYVLACCSRLSTAQERLYLWLWVPDFTKFAHLISQPLRRFALCKTSHIHYLNQGMACKKPNVSMVSGLFWRSTNSSPWRWSHLHMFVGLWKLLVCKLTPRGQSICRTTKRSVPVVIRKYSLVLISFFRAPFIMICKEIRLLEVFSTDMR